jgi:predicted metal-dependent phosphotriesterase family hydrolase
MIGWNDFMPDEIRAERIAALVRAGFERQILLSTDTCRKSHLHANGGRGFDHVWTAFLPLLRAEGVTEAQIDSMMIEAPRRLLAREGT